MNNLIRVWRLSSYFKQKMILHDKHLCLARWLVMCFVTCSLVNQALTQPAAVTRKAKLRDLDDSVRQRVIIHFLTQEKVGQDEIERRLKPVFGENTVDVKEVASPDEQQAWTLDPRLSQRVVIQFLSGEGAGPKEIFERLKAVYGECTPLSSVQRWAKQFRDGRTSVGNMPRGNRTLAAKSS